MKSDGSLHALDERLADQLRFLVEIDRLKGVVRANRVADAVERGWLRAAPR